MPTVCVVETEYSSIVRALSMRKQEREVILHDFPSGVDPDLFAEDADAARTAEAGLVVGFLAQMPARHPKKVYYR